jgi:RsiW-degrading membrane proteinase PrsW (M82 family)
MRAVVKDRPMTLLMLAAAVAPALIILRLLIRLDRFPEPTHLIVKTFLLGMLATIPVGVTGFFLPQLLEGIRDPIARTLIDAFAATAGPEEFFKFCVLYFFCMRHDDFDEPMDGLVYGLTASLGFACLENVLYLAGAGEDWPVLAVTRAFMAVPGHAMDGVVMGFFAALGRFDAPRSRHWYFLALAVPITLHGLYDWPLFLIDDPALANVSGVAGLLILVPVLVVLVDLFWGVRLLRGLRRLQADTVAGRKIGIDQIAVL